MTKRRGRGEGAIYKKAENLWCAQLSTGYDGNATRKRRYVYGKTKTEVQKKLAELQSAFAAGSLADPKRMRLVEFINHWLEDVARPTIRISTHARYKVLLKVHLLPHLGGIQISSLEPSHIQNLYKKLEETGASPRTREFVHAVLRKALDQAMKWGYVQRNVCDMVARPRVPKKAMRCWNREEANQFLVFAETRRYYGLYVLALTTGLRQGELFGLRWEDIDFESSSLSVVRTINQVDSKMIIGEPKTAKGRRRVELPEIAIRALKKHREKMLAEGNHKDWIFCTAKGDPIKKNSFRNSSFLPLLKASGLPKIRFHDLRHTAATLLLSQGVHPKVVQERLGHAQISITLDIYSHVLPSMQKEAAAKLDILFPNLEITR